MKEIGGKKVYEREKHTLREREKGERGRNDGERQRVGSWIDDQRVVERERGRKGEKVCVSERERQKEEHIHWERLGDMHSKEEKTRMMWK